MNQPAIYFSAENNKEINETGLLESQMASGSAYHGSRESKLDAYWMLPIEWS
jgi:hypothetical protein